MRDELQELIDEQMENPAFRDAYEDAGTRHAVLDALVAERRAQGLKQRHVARRMGVKQPTVSEFECESSDPRLSTLQRYARAVGGRIDISFVAIHVESPSNQKEER